MSGVNSVGAIGGGTQICIIHSVWSEGEETKEEDELETCRRIVTNGIGESEDVDDMSSSQTSDTATENCEVAGFPIVLSDSSVDEVENSNEMSVKLSPQILAALEGYRTLKVMVKNMHLKKFDLDCSINKSDKIELSLKNYKLKRKRVLNETQHEGKLESSKMIKKLKLDAPGGKDSVKPSDKMEAIIASKGTQRKASKLQQSSERLSSTEAKCTLPKKFSSCRIKKCYSKLLYLNHRNLKAILMKFMKKSDADLDNSAQLILTQIQLLQTHKLQLINYNDDKKGEDEELSNNEASNDIQIPCQGDLALPLGPLSNTVDSPNYVSSQKNRDTVSTVSQHSRGPSSNGDQIFFKAVTFPKFGRIPKLKGSAEELRSNRHVPVSAKMNQRTKILELLRRIEEFKPIIQNIVDTSTKEKRGAPELAADADIDEIGDLNDEGWEELKSLKEESEIVNYFKKRFNNRLSSNPLINLSWYGSNSSIKNNNLSEKNVDAFENKFNVDNENSNGDVTLPDFEIKLREKNLNIFLEKHDYSSTCDKETLKQLAIYFRHLETGFEENRGFLGYFTSKGLSHENVDLAFQAEDHISSYEKIYAGANNFDCESCGVEHRFRVK